MSDNFSPEMLDLALTLSTEWGENFRKPIHERIRVTHPDLTDDEIEKLTAIAREAEFRIYKLAEMSFANEISESDAAATAMKEFPWISSANVARLSNIGMYYAMR